jgi:hypothetical protein
LFGEVFRYNKIYLGKEVNGDFVTVEELVDGEFVKYINNDGIVFVRMMTYPLIKPKA